jgi:NAD+ kinase
MKIAIFGNTYRHEVQALINLLIDFFSDRDVHLLFEKKLYPQALQSDKFNEKSVHSIESADFEADFAFSIGGDGTFLHTALNVGNKGIPILGINMGRLGFLADVAENDVRMALNALLNGNYVLEDRTLLHVATDDEAVELKMPNALNDVVVLKKDSSSMISVDLSVNGEFVHTYQSDGLIIATPTGSTAYSMSVGGPLVVPGAKSFILSPVASHSLSVRPLIIPDDWEIELSVSSRSHSFLIAIDGRSNTLSEKTKLKIKKADYTIRLIKQEGYTFFDTLKNKLLWGIDKRS